MQSLLNTSLITVPGGDCQCTGLSYLVIHFKSQSYQLCTVLIARFHPASSTHNSSHQSGLDSWLICFLSLWCEYACSTLSLHRLKQEQMFLHVVIFCRALRRMGNCYLLNSGLCGCSGYCWWKHVKLQASLCGPHLLLLSNSEASPSPHRPHSNGCNGRVGFF